MAVRAPIAVPSMIPVGIIGLFIIPPRPERRKGLGATPLRVGVDPVAGAQIRVIGEDRAGEFDLIMVE